MAWRKLHRALLVVTPAGELCATDLARATLGLAQAARTVDALEPCLRELRDGSATVRLAARVLALQVDTLNCASGRVLELSEAGEPLRELFDALPDGTLLFDAAGERVLEANREAERLLEVSPGHLRMVPPTSLLEALRRDTPTVLPWRAVDGQTRLLEVRAGPLTTVGERALRSATVRDVSARLRAEDERTKSLEAMANARTFEALGLVAGIAHDLRNVLSIISAFAGGLHGDLPAGEQREDAQQIRTAARRAEGLVRRLVDFAKPNASATEDYDAFDAVREAVALCEPALGPRFQLRVQLPPDTRAPLVGDKGQLVLALVNLLFNARDAMPDGGVIALDATRWGRRGVLRVRDCGHGMSPDVLRRAFEPFFTTKPPGVGTGLGLPLVRSCARAHGGDVRLESEPGRGTTVTIWLPVDVADPEPLAPRAPPEQPRGQALVVDDDDVVCLLLRTLLERQGFSVSTTTRPEEALPLLRQLPRAALAVCDLVLPGTDGAELLRRLKAERPDLCVVVASGFIDEGDVDRVRALGAADVLAKPFSKQEFEVCVERALLAAAGTPPR